MLVMEARLGCCLFLILALYECTANDTSIPEEIRLFNYLFKEQNYDKRLRPLQDKSKSVQVSLSLAYVQLVELDIRSQTLKSNVWIRQTWTNELLRWDRETFGGVNEMTIDKKLLWVPDLVLHNNANSKMNRALVDQALTRIKIKHDGTHQWFTPAMLYSSCSVDITFFPFDYQSCPLKFGSWTYDLEGINLTLADHNAADTSFYLPSSDIELLSFEGRRNVNFYPCCQVPFIDVTFHIILKRLPGFYIYNVILPSITITIFALAAFAFPDENSGRTSLILSCFLALVILSMMIASTMPVNSDTTPLIAIFMLTSMAQMCASGFVNCFCVILYKERRQPLPKWLRILFIEMLGPCLRINQPPIVHENETCAPLLFGLRDHEIETEFNGKDVYYHSSSSRHARGFNHMNKTNSFSSRTQRKSSATREPRLVSAQRTITNMADIMRMAVEKGKQNETVVFWRCVSKVMDRIIFLVLLFSWSVSVFLLAMKIPKGM